MMAHYKRGRCRKLHTKAKGRCPSANPAWWDRAMHTPQWRARSHKCERQIMRGSDPDGLAWPLYTKPHIYYW